MDVATKRWMILTLALTLVTLGFAAMSTSSTFAIPNWLPLVFFIMAVGAVIWLFVSLVRSRTEEARLRARRRGIAAKLSELFLDGEIVKSKFKTGDFSGDAVAIANEWSQSVKKYFTENPDELGTARLISLRPRQSDWFVYGHFNPFGDKKRDEKYLAFQTISIEMEKLADIVGEFMR